MTDHFPLSSIRTDAGTQPRAGTSAEVVDDYAALLTAGTDLPPVVVFHDGTAHYLADGYHRFEAHAKLKRKKIAADVRQGSLRDAILYSLSANQAHGLRRTNGDKRRAAERLLRDDEWSKWSDNRIATHIGVSQPFVSAVRRELFPAAPSNNGYKSDAAEQRVGRDGKARSVVHSPKRAASVTDRDIAQDAPPDDEPVRQVDEPEHDPETGEITDDEIPAALPGEAVPAGPVLGATTTADLPEGGETEGRSTEDQESWIVPADPDFREVEADLGVGAEPSRATDAVTLSRAEYDALVKRAGASPWLVAGRPVSAVEYSYSLLRDATKKAAPDEIAEQYQAAMFSDDITRVNTWLLDFEDAFRKLHGAGSKAAMEQDAA